MGGEVMFLFRAFIYHKRTRYNGIRIKHPVIYLIQQCQWLSYTIKTNKIQAHGRSSHVLVPGLLLNSSFTRFLLWILLFTLHFPGRPPDRLLPGKRLVRTLPHDFMGANNPK